MGKAVERVKMKRCGWCLSVYYHDRTCRKGYVCFHFSFVYADISGSEIGVVIRVFVHQRVSDGSEGRFDVVN